jgi:ADP-ribose pyrophosphatase
MPPKPWKTLSSRQVYQNNWINVREDRVELPNKKTTIYGVCDMGECVGVLPFVDDNHVIMVRQYRYVQQENHRWEMPTGGMHTGESAEDAAQRELMEEIGYQAGELTWVNSFYSSKSVCDETAHLYIGRNLAPAQAPPDETEFIEVATFPFANVLHMVINGDIRDSMTIIAVLFAAQAQ